MNDNRIGLDLEEKVACYAENCGQSFSNARSFSVHFKKEHSPPVITAAHYRKLANYRSIMCKQLCFHIKQALVNFIKPTATIALPCEEDLYLSLFYTIDKSLFRYNYYPSSRAHRHVFEAIDGKSQDDVVGTVSKVLKQEDDSWIRRYYPPWRGESNGAAYIDVDPVILKRRSIVFRSVVKKIKEASGVNAFIIHEQRFIKIYVPINRC
jgi:hypothetical protein